MKELSIEEKAKRYDEIIEIAKKWRNAPNVDKIPTFANRVIDEIFSELKESEDERIRKELIDYFSASHATDTFRGISWDRVVAWLEKQGEQKPVEVRTIGYWNVQDIEQKPVWSEEDKRNLQGIIDEIEANKHSAPDCDIATYDGFLSFLESLKYRCAYQPKHEWSEKDKIYIEYIRLAVENQYPIAAINIVDWLKHLKDRYTWNPSDEQMEALKEVCDKHWEPDGLEPLYTLYQDLKKLKE